MKPNSRTRLQVFRRVVWRVASVVAGAFALCMNAYAWPDRPVRVVVGFSAGGPTDVVARAFAEFASREIGQPVVVENRPGANTIIAAELVASAPADGYTLLFAATNHTMIPALYRDRIKFDPLRSFAPVCTIAVSPTVLVTGPSMPVANLKDFMSTVRQSPGVRTYGTPGTGSSGHFVSEQFLRANGLSMNHIPYKGAAQVVTDVMAGQLDSSFATVGSVLQQIQAGKLHAVAVASDERSPLLPEVPTFAESGVSGYLAEAWYGLLAPAKTPADILQALERISGKFTDQASTASRLKSLGMNTSNICGNAFASQMKAETDLYSALAHDLKLSAE